MLIRTERSGDEPAISAVIAWAFAGPEAGQVPSEVGLVDRLRRSPSWIPQLSLIAVDGDEIIGHCLCTRGRVGDFPVLALGPIAATPPRQRAGVGAALIHETIEIALDMDEVLIGLVGDYDYYGRFGFESGASAGVEAPLAEWGSYFQVLRLPGLEPRGKFRYPDEFGVAGSV